LLMFRPTGSIENKEMYAAGNFLKNPLEKC
jgi:hypothetical protein